jgi:tripartite-type tricarboxylate transporter receptor subunit TctC
MTSDRVDASFQLVPNVAEQVKAGQIRALAVTVGHRVPALAEIPTMAEQGVQGYETAGWFGLLAPRGTPPAIIERLHRDSAAILASTAMRQRLEALGCEPMPYGPEEFRRFIAAELPRWAEIVKRSGAQLD